VYTQFYGGPTDYNEVWSLLVDNVGEYYFAILYMQNSNHSQVIIEHLLRLTDYQKMNGQWVDAKWTKGLFDSTLTIRTPFPNSLVKVDGFPFQTNSVGILSTVVPKGTLTVEVPQEIQDSPNSRTRFLTWSKFGESNPLKVMMNSSVDVTAKYVHEYRMNVNSEFVATNGTGWYAEGTNATFVVASNLLDLGNGTRHVFVRWEGASNSTSPNAWAIVNSGQDVTAMWKTQYALSISAPGLSPNTSINVLVGKDLIKLNGSKPYTQWADAYQQLSIVVQNPQITSPNGNYAFSELRADNQTFGGVLIVTQPMTVWLMYNQTQSAAPAISVQSTPSHSQRTGMELFESAAALVLGSNRVPLLMQGLLNHLKGVPYISALIGLTTTLVNLGTLLAAPYGPPIAGFFIGSMFVGFIYVFPVSALALLYRSAKTKRRPRNLKLLPLGIVWGISLTIVILSTNVIALRPLVALSEMLLVLTNALLFPLLAAYQVARLVA
jgi:hypothetical protein